MPSAGVPPAGKAGVMFAVRFVYPRVAAVGSGTPAAPVVLNERYQFCGARAVKPTRVFDDGVRTTLLFGIHQEVPAVFVQNADGSESLVNFSVEGDAVILHRVAEHFVLRRGSLVGCLRNRGLADGSLAGGSPAGAAHGGVVEPDRPVAGAAGRSAEAGGS
jgi:Conjugal transfer protein